MSTSLKWKSKLLSSGLPLEYEAASLLAAKGFAVSADYAYARNDSGLTKDFSVDIHARAFPPFSDPNEISAELDLLVECKHRHSNVTWLFMPDPNKEDFSPLTGGYTLRSIDMFSRWFLPSGGTADFEREMEMCYKGMEIDGSDGRVYDSEIKHGLSQLQYALPRLLSDTALFNIYSHPDDNVPFLICPILLTTASLLVAARTLTRDKVQAARDVSDLGKQVPYLISYSDTGPDFDNHRQRACAGLIALHDNPTAQAINEHRLKNGEYSFRAPIVYGRSLGSGSGGRFPELFSQFVVCNVSHFADLVTRIRQIVSRTTRARAVVKTLLRRPRS